MGWLEDQKTPGQQGEDFEKKKAAPKKPAAKKPAAKKASSK